MTTALHLIQAAILLTEIASGDAELDIRRPLVRLADDLKSVPNLAGVAEYMTAYAHGDTHDFALANMYLETLQNVAASVSAC